MLVNLALWLWEQQWDGPVLPALDLGELPPFITCQLFMELIFSQLSQIHNTRPMALEMCEICSALLREDSGLVLRALLMSQHICNMSASKGRVLSMWFAEKKYCHWKYPNSPWLWSAAETPQEDRSQQMWSMFRQETGQEAQDGPSWYEAGLTGPYWSDGAAHTDMVRL